MGSHNPYSKILIKSKQGLSYSTEYLMGLCIFSANKLGTLKMNDLITFYPLSFFR